MPKENANPGTAEQQLKGFIAKFEPKHQTAIRALRKALRQPAQACIQAEVVQYAGAQQL